MAAESFTCDNCGVQSAAAPLETLTGRHLCESCYDTLQGMVAGVIGAGRGATVEQQMAGGIATAAWFARIKGWRKGR